MTWNVQFSGNVFFQNHRNPLSCFSHFCRLTPLGRRTALISILTMLLLVILGFLGLSGFSISRPIIVPLVGSLFSLNLAICSWAYLHHVDWTLINEDQVWTLTRDGFHIQWKQKESDILWSQLDHIKWSRHFFFLARGNQMWVLPLAALPDDSVKGIKQQSGVE